MTLYEISEGYKFLACVDWENEDERKAAVNALAELNDELERKAENVAYVLKNLGAEVEAIKGEEARLANKRRALENAQERLKAAQMGVMTIAKKERLKAGILDLRIRAGPPALVVIDESAVPEQFWVMKRDISRQAIKDALEAGETVPGVEVVRNKHLVIR